MSCPHGNWGECETCSEIDAAWRTSNETIAARDREIASLQQQLREAQGLLRESIEDIDDWASYASDYFREKHDLAGTLARYRAALTPAPECETFKQVFVSPTCGGKRYIGEPAFPCIGCPDCSATDDRETCDHDNDPATCPECHGPFGVGA